MKAYSEYKDSGIDWLGRIPSHWKVLSTKRLFHILSGATPRSDKENYWDGNIVWITPADYNTADHYISTGSRSISQEGYSSCSTEMVPKGSIIFSKRAPIGKVCIANANLCTNQGCLCCIPFANVSSNYYYYLMSIQGNYYNQLGSGSTFLEISTLNFSESKLLVPSFKEQEAIAAFLDKKTTKIDELITEKTKQVEDLRAYRTSVITEAVTHGLNPEAPLRSSGIDWIGDIPVHWGISKIKYYAEIKSGDSIENALIIEDGEFPIYGGGELIGYTNMFNIDEYTIIVGRVGARCGCVKLTEKKAWATDNALIVTTSHNVLFLMRLLEAANLNRLNESNAQPLITATKIKNIQIPLPPLSEQNEIATYLDAKTAQIDQLIDELNQQLVELAEYKQAVISEAVTGKVDVRDC
jgi:type I restriction enzyme S subunit